MWGDVARWHLSVRGAHRPLERPDLGQRDLHLVRARRLIEHISVQRVLGVQVRARRRLCVGLGAPEVPHVQRRAGGGGEEALRGGEELRLRLGLLGPRQPTRGRMHRVRVVGVGVRVGVRVVVRVVVGVGAVGGVAGGGGGGAEGAKVAARREEECAWHRVRGVMRGPCGV